MPVSWALWGQWLYGKYHLLKSYERWARKHRTFYSQVRGKAAVVTSTASWEERHPFVWNAAGLNDTDDLSATLLRAFPLFLSTSRKCRSAPPGGTVDSRTISSRAQGRQQSYSSHKFTELVLHCSNCQNNTILAVFHLKLNLFLTGHQRVLRGVENNAVGLAAKLLELPGWSEPGQGGWRQLGPSWVMSNALA